MTFLLATLLTFVPSPSPGALHACRAAWTKQTPIVEPCFDDPARTCPGLRQEPWVEAACIVDGNQAMVAADPLPGEILQFCVCAYWPGTGCSACAEPVTR